MKLLPNQELKSILHSKRANMYLLEHCRILQKDGRILYLTDDSEYFNIPVANTTVILLGNGTSITQAAVRVLCQAGVLVGFCGGGGTPLYMGCDIEWYTPQNEYRPTEYLRAWLTFCFDEEKRLAQAKRLQNFRFQYLESVWNSDRDLQEEGFCSSEVNFKTRLDATRQEVDGANGVTELLLIEARFTKFLFRHATNKVNSSNFSRKHDANDLANTFLNHGNYLAYGLAATALWVLGIPHGLALMHGKTRRGALVFDIADLIKDAIVLPWSFICAKENATEQEFRQQILQAFIDHRALDYIFKIVEKIALQQY